MKTIALLVFVSCFGVTFLFSQNINIPDENFLAALITEGVDANKDGFISYGEAEDVDSLLINNQSENWEEGGGAFENAIGIEAFLNLVYLNISGRGLNSIDISKNTALQQFYCSGNELTTLDVSRNTALTVLICGCYHYGCYGGNELIFLDVSHNTKLEWLSLANNQLTALDISKNPALKGLNCEGNQLKNLEVSKNDSLEYLGCGFNQLTKLDLPNNSILLSLTCGNNFLTNLDISNARKLRLLYCEYNQLATLSLSENPDLENLDCSNNPLGNLDISNNTRLEFLALTNIPTLVEVCVWGLPFPTDEITLWEKDSPNIIFTTSCTYGLEDKNLIGISIYPNPFSSFLTIETEISDYLYIEIISMSGQLIYTALLEENSRQIDLSSITRGIYFITIRSKEDILTNKIIKL